MAYQAENWRTLVWEMEQHHTPLPAFKKKRGRERNRKRNQRGRREKREEKAKQVAREVRDAKLKEEVKKIREKFYEYRRRETILIETTDEESDL